MERMYNELSDSQRKDVVIIFSTIMSDEDVPFQEHEDISGNLSIWNPTIIMVDEVVSCFSEKNKKSIERMVQHRLLKPKSK